MDALLPILCLLLGITLPLGVVYLVARRAWRQLAVAEAYRVVARRLGLSIDTRGVSVHGHLGDRRLYVGEVLVGHGTERTTEYRGVLGLERPLGLGLLIRPRRSRRWLRRRARAQKVRTEDEQFDKSFEVYGDDDERVNTLLTSEVKAVIAETARRWPHLMVTDHHVRVLLSQPEASPEGLGALVEALRRVADALLEARRGVRPPKSLERVVPAWSKLADQLGLDFEPWLPALAGALHDRPVRVHARREADGYLAEILVSFREHRTLGFRMQPQVAPDGYWSVGQDIQIGDPAFDRSFVIKGYDPNAVRRILSEPVRRVLSELADEGSHLDLDDRRIRIRQVPLEADAVRAVLERAIDAAEATGW